MAKKRSRVDADAEKLSNAVDDVLAALPKGENFAWYALVLMRAAHQLLKEGDPDEVERIETIIGAVLEMHMRPKQ